MPPREAGELEEVEQAMLSKVIKPPGSYQQQRADALLAAFLQHLFPTWREAKLCHERELARDYSPVGLSWI